MGQTMTLTIEGKVKTVNSSLKRYLVLPFVVMLALMVSASGGSGDPQPQGKGLPTVTFYVA